VAVSVYIERITMMAVSERFHLKNYRDDAPTFTCVIREMSCGIAVYRAWAEIFLNMLAIREFVSTWLCARKATKEKKVSVLQILVT
jgi:hypothetical protein